MHKNQCKYITKDAKTGRQRNTQQTHKASAKQINRHISG